MIKNETIYIYTNPGFNQRYNGGIKKLEKIFNELNCQIEFIDLDFLQKNIPLEKASQKLMIVGGDGTLHIVLNNIPEKLLDNYIFGVLPCGTANEYAKFLGMPKNLYESCKIIASSNEIVYNNIGLVNKKHKFMTGILYGAPVNVLSTTSDRAKWILGSRAFYSGFSKFILNFLNKKNFLLKSFKLNNMSFSTNFLMINNASLTSKDVQIKEFDSKEQEVFFVIYLNADMKLKDILRLAFKHEFKKTILNDKAIHFSQQKTINLTFKNKAQLTLDGEFYTFNSPVKIEFLSKKLAFIVK